MNNGEHEQYHEQHYTFFICVVISLLTILPVPFNTHGIKSDYHAALQSGAGSMHACLADICISGIRVLTVKTAAAMEENPPITIRADRLEAFPDDNRAVFSGNVEAEQKGVKVIADRIEVFYESTDNPGSGIPRKSAEKRIDLITATGNVTIKFDGREATCEKAEYLPGTETIILSGQDVIIKSKDNRIIGNRIVIDQKTGKIAVDSDDAKQVEVFFSGQKVTDTINKTNEQIPAAK